MSQHDAENELQIFVRHLRWFVNFFAEPNLVGEELDTICSNIEGKLENAESLYADMQEEFEKLRCRWPTGRFPPSGHPPPPLGSTR